MAVSQKGTEARERVVSECASVSSFSEKVVLIADCAARLWRPTAIDRRLLCSALLVCGMRTQAAAERPLAASAAVSRQAISWRRSSASCVIRATLPCGTLDAIIKRLQFIDGRRASEAALGGCRCKTPSAYNLQLGNAASASWLAFTMVRRFNGCRSLLHGGGAAAHAPRPSVVPIVANRERIGLDRGASVSAATIGGAASDRQQRARRTCMDGRTHVEEALRHRARRRLLASGAACLAPVPRETSDNVSNL